MRNTPGSLRSPNSRSRKPYELLRSAPVRDQRLEKNPRASPVVVTSLNTHRVAYSAAAVARLTDRRIEIVTAITRPRERRAAALVNSGTAPIRTQSAKAPLEA